MYMSEALVALDSIADAVELLSPDTVTDVSVLSPEIQHRTDDKGDKNGDNDQETSKGGALYPWSPRELPLARAIMQYNLAVAHTVRGEFDKALIHINQSSKDIEQPYPAQLYFLKIYLELMEGRRKKAVTIIRENFGHIEPNRISP